MRDTPRLAPSSVAKSPEADIVSTSCADYLDHNAHGALVTAAHPQEVVLHGRSLGARRDIHKFEGTRWQP